MDRPLARRQTAENRASVRRGAQWHGKCTLGCVSRTIPIFPAASQLPQGGAEGEAPQRVVKVRRDYNSWVASETMEDYALRYAPQRFRKWSTFRVANTAFGA
ncbi:MAG: hypothetical protein ABIR26_09425, partial [Ramlibacter sp.]